MTAKPDRERRRRLRAEYKRTEREEWLAALPLDEDAHAALLDHLDIEVGTRGCDHSLRFTERWLVERNYDVGEVSSKLVHMGGGCDCEVLANLDPETHV